MARQLLGKNTKAFQLEGLPELQANIAKVLDRTSAAKLKDVYLDGARVLLNEFRADAPVKTGRFRASGFIAKGDPRKPDALFIIDYKVAPHAHIVEYGSSKHPPHHTVRNAITTTRSLIARVIADGFRAAIEAAVK